MLKKTFLGILKKYENHRVEKDIYKYFTIKHVSEGSVQTFLDPLTKELGVENIKEIFKYPVRWKKIEFDVSDYVQRHYKINFAQVNLEADLYDIKVKRKLVNGTDVFEYFLSFMKPSSEDITDNLMVEAYLDYKDENEEGKNTYVEFEVKIELTDKKESYGEESLL